MRPSQAAYFGRSCAAASFPVPALPRGCGSWIATSPDGTRYLEVWNEYDARALGVTGWTVRTAVDHLSRLNLPATNTGD